MFVVACILPEQLLSATRCRVERYRINAGVVALGESLRLIVAWEASLLPNYIRVKATTNCYCSNFVWTSCGFESVAMLCTAADDVFKPFSIIQSYPCATAAVQQQLCSSRSRSPAVGLSHLLPASWTALAKRTHFGSSASRYHHKLYPAFTSLPNTICHLSLAPIYRNTRTLHRPCFLAPALHCSV